MFNLLPHSVAPACSNEFVRSDQLLSWIAAHVTPSPGSASTLRSGGSNATAATVAPATPPAALAAGAPTFGPAPTQRRHSHSPSVGSEVQSPRIADIQPFELSFWDLKMERSVGRGSFGKGEWGRGESKQVGGAWERGVLPWA